LSIGASGSCRPNLSLPESRVRQPSDCPVSCATVHHMRQPPPVTNVICGEVDNVLTLSLCDGPNRLVEFLFWYDFDAHEVVNGDGVVAHEAVSSWQLTRRDLHLEYDRRSAAKLGFPRVHQVRIELSDQQFAEVRAALVEIIGIACHDIQE
jgi:hypothetical protein